MKNLGDMKTFLALAILLAIAEIVLLAIGKGGLPVNRRDSFCYVLCSGLYSTENRKIKRIIIYIANFRIRFIYTIFPATIHQLGI